jgi:hypothetical protein
MESNQQSKGEITNRLDITNPWHVEGNFRTYVYVPLSNTEASSKKNK